MNLFDDFTFIEVPFLNSDFSNEMESYESLEIIQTENAYKPYSSPFRNNKNNDL